MQITSYPLPSASVQRSTSLDNYNPKPQSMVSHSVSSKLDCTETSINSNSSIFPSSNNKTPLITIPEDWATRDASQPRTIPLSKGSTKNRPKHDPQYISSLPNQSFHAIKSHYGRLDSCTNRQITQKRMSKISRSMSSSSSKSYRRQHQERKQEREHYDTSQRQYNDSLETHSTVTERLHGTAAVDSQIENKVNQRSVSKKEDEDDYSDQRSDESDSDSSDSSDGSQSASRSHSDDESRQDDNASTDEEDSGSNATRSGSSSSCSSEGEDDSSSSSCSSNQVIYFHRTKVSINIYTHIYISLSYWI